MGGENRRSDILREIRLAEMLLEIVGLEVVDGVRLQDRATGAIYDIRRVRGELEIENANPCGEQ